MIETVKLTCKIAWWAKPAIWSAVPIFIFNEYLGERYINWIARHAVTFHVR